MHKYIDSQFHWIGFDACLCSFKHQVVLYYDDGNEEPIVKQEIEKEYNHMSLQWY